MFIVYGVFCFIIGFLLPHANALEFIALFVALVLCIWGMVEHHLFSYYDKE